MKKLLCAVFALFGASAIHAQPEFAYYGLSVGDFEYKEEFLGQEIFSDTGRSYHLMVGYQFMEHLTVEGGYGKTNTLRGTNDVLFQPPITFSVDFQVLTLRLLGVLPFDNGLALLGGIAYSDMKQGFTQTNGIQTFSDDQSSNDPSFYAAAQYNWERFAVRVGFDKRDFGDTPFGEVGEVTETSITFFYKL